MRLRPSPPARQVSTSDPFLRLIERPRPSSRGSEWAVEGRVGLVRLENLSDALPLESGNERAQPQVRAHLRWKGRNRYPSVFATPHRRFVMAVGRATGFGEPPLPVATATTSAAITAAVAAAVQVDTASGGESAVTAACSADDAAPAVAAAGPTVVTVERGNVASGLSIPATACGTTAAATSKCLSFTVLSRTVALRLGKAPVGSQTPLHEITWSHVRRTTTIAATATAIGPESVTAALAGATMG